MFRKNSPVGKAPPLEEIKVTEPSVPMMSCCCPARPAVKVIMPPTADRAYPVDLWLCGHHYRASLGPLLAAGASVTDLTAPDGSPQAEHAAAPGVGSRGGSNQ